MEFILDYPPSVNHLYVHGSAKKVKTPEALAWEEAALWDIKKQKKGQDEFSYNKDLLIYLFRADERRVDIDNPLKEILDLLTKSGLIKDDSQIYHLEVRKKASKNGKNYIMVELF